MLEGSIPPCEARERQEPLVLRDPGKQWGGLKELKPQVANSAEKLSAELVITTYISVGSPCKYLKVRICIDSGSRVPLLFRRNLISNLRRAQNPIKMCTASDQPLPGGSMGSDLSIALPIALPNAKGELVERNYRLQEWGYEGAIGGGGVDILLGYPILVKYGIAILPRLDMLTLDSFAGSKPTPPPKGTRPSLHSPCLQNWRGGHSSARQWGAGQSSPETKEKKGK